MIAQPCRVNINNEKMKFFFTKKWNFAQISKGPPEGSCGPIWMGDSSFFLVLNSALIQYQAPSCILKLLFISMWVNSTSEFSSILSEKNTFKKKSVQKCGCPPSDLFLQLPCGVGDFQRVLRQIRLDDKTRDAAWLADIWLIPHSTKESTWKILRWLRTN